MKPKRIISFLLAICLVAGLMPTVAFATESDKAIMLDTGNISGYDSTKGYDYIYYGNWSAPDNHTTSGPIKWRVLDDRTNTGGAGLFLLSDVLLGSGTDGGVYFDESSPRSNAWQDSDARTWCENFYSSKFSTGEQSAVIATTKSDEAFTSSTYPYRYAASENILNGDKVFFLSAQEAENSEYGFTNDAARIANYGGSAGVWWLRSPLADYTGIAGVVDSYGYVGTYNVHIAWAARPAFNLDLTSVLFTSAAVGGKSASGMDSGLTAVDDYTGSEWKLTLLDETREFAVTEQTVSGAPGDTITLNYTGATTGENEYISVIIADENGAQYYGRVAQPDSADGQVKIKIPDSLAAGEYTLNVFSEQYNGDYKTDYASAFAEVALTVEEAAAPGIDTGKAIQLVDSGTAANIGGGQADNIYFGTYQQSSAGSTEPDGTEGVDWIKSDTANKNGQDPYYYIDPVKWRVLSNASGQLFLLSDQNLDVFQYHTDSESVTWEKSTMRSWLNGYGAAQNTGSDNGIDYTSDNFIGTAFSEKEQKAIADTTVVNDDNPDHNTEGGNDTTDQIFLLSLEEVQNADYGFTDNSSRIATNTAYVAGGGEIGGNMLHGVGEADYWWLRSPGDLDHRATGVSVDGGVGGYGYSVRIAYLAVRPAFNLDLTSVLFTSAAVGGKSASGMDSGLTAIGNYDGNEWKLTLLDEAHKNFEISNATITDTITFSYSGAATGTNEYISAVVVDNGAITHYGRILQPRSTSGTASFTIPDGVTLSDTVKLYVFNEQYNSDKMTDYASQLKEISRPTVDTTAPKLTAGDATRTGETTATVKFTSSEAGSYYYEVVNSGENQPTIDTDGTGTTCGTTEQTISLTNLSGAGAKDIYIVAKDAAGNVSQPLKITIPAYIAPSYGISASPAALNFGSETEGYADAPAAQTVTIKNIGKLSVTVDLPTSAKYTITAGTGFENGAATLASDDTATFTVQPNTGLDAGSHDDILNISGNDGTSASVKLSFTVNAVYTLTVNLNGGNGNATDGEYPAGKDVNIDAGTRSGYRFVGWTSSNGGTFADPSSASTTFTMPAADTTITANWTYSGGGGGYSDDDDEPDQPADPDDTGVSDLLNTEDHIQYLFGYPDGTFGPENNMTRAEVAQMFYNLLLDQDVEITKTFDDVPANAWYTKAVNTLASLDIISGVGDNKFEPERSITRAEFTSMAMKFAVGGEEGKNIFSDVDEDDWFYDAVVNSIQYGWIHGYGDGTFRPNNPITRAEVTAIVNNMLGRAADEDFVDEHTDELTPFSDSEKHWAYYHSVEATNDHDYTKPSSGENWTRLN